MLNTTRYRICETAQRSGDSENRECKLGEGAGVEREKTYGKTKHQNKTIEKQEDNNN